MTSAEPTCVDPASAVITVFIDLMRKVFGPDSSCPPDEPGVDVRFFAGDGAPLAAWDAHSSGGNCSAPFLWVRLMRRYRTAAFPAQTTEVNPCGLGRVAVVEVGVGRCAVVDLEPSWADYAREAEMSLDDSWRIETVLCAAAKRLNNDGHRVGTDTIAPYGPEGGVVAWTGMAYVEI